MTVDSHITLTNNNLTLQKIGKMVFANLMFTTTAEITANTKMIDNILYKPYINNQSFIVFQPGSKNSFILRISRNDGTNTSHIVTMDTIPTSINVRGLLSVPVI